MVKQTLASLLTAVYLISNVVLAHSAQSNIWAERRKISQPKPKDVQYAGFPASLQSPQMKAQDLLQKLPELKKIETTLPKATSKLQKNMPLKVSSLLEAIPLNRGTIKDVHLSKNIGGNAPFVVLLQDVHANFEAQQNLAEILLSMGKKGALTVGVEGAFGDFDFSWYRAFENKDLIKAVADCFLEKNKIAAPSYVGLVADKESARFVGVDDPAQYEANVEAVRSTALIKDKVRKELKKRDTELAETKSKTLNADLLRYDQLKANYLSGQMGFGDYLLSLSAASSHLLKGDGADNDGLLELDIEQFLVAYNIERTLDFKRVEEERGKIVRALAEKISDDELKQLVTEGLAFQAGKISFAEYYRDIHNRIALHGISLAQTPSFDKYIKYVLLSDGIKVERLMDAVTRLEKNVLATLTKTPKEKELMAQSQHLYLTSRLVEFALTPEEWEEYKETSPNPSTVRHGGEFLSMSQNGEDRRGIDLSAFEQFYIQADLRSESMVKNLLANPKSEAQSPKDNLDLSPKVLVTGGFHTPLIAEILKKHGVSYAVVQPKITKIESGNGTEYLSIFTREKTPLDKLFEGEKLFLADGGMALGTRGSGANRVAGEASALMIAVSKLRGLVFPNGRGSVAVKGNSAEVEMGNVAVRVSPSGAASVETTYDLGEFGRWVMSPVGQALLETVAIGLFAWATEQYKSLLVVGLGIFYFLHDFSRTLSIKSFTGLLGSALIFLPFFAGEQILSASLLSGEIHVFWNGVLAPHFSKWVPYLFLFEGKSKDELNAIIGSKPFVWEVFPDVKRVLRSFVQAKRKEDWHRMGRDKISAKEDQLSFLSRNLFLVYLNSSFDVELHQAIEDAFIEKIKSASRADRALLFSGIAETLQTQVELNSQASEFLGELFLFNKGENDGPEAVNFPEFLSEGEYLCFIEYLKKIKSPEEMLLRKYISKFNMGTFKPASAWPSRFSAFMLLLHHLQKYGPVNNEKKLLQTELRHSFQFHWTESVENNTKNFVLGILEIEEFGTELSGQFFDYFLQFIGKYEKNTNSVVKGLGSSEVLEGLKKISDPKKEKIIEFLLQHKKIDDILLAYVRSLGGMSKQLFEKINELCDLQRKVQNPKYDQIVELLVLAIGKTNQTEVNVSGWVEQLGSIIEGKDPNVEGSSVVEGLVDGLASFEQLPTALEPIIKKIIDILSQRREQQAEGLSDDQLQIAIGLRRNLSGQKIIGKALDTLALAVLEEISRVDSPLDKRQFLPFIERVFAFSGKISMDERTPTVVLENNQIPIKRDTTARVVYGLIVTASRMGSNQVDQILKTFKILAEGYGKLSRFDVSIQQQFVNAIYDAVSDISECSQEFSRSLIDFIAGENILSMDGSAIDAFKVFKIGVKAVALATDLEVDQKEISTILIRCAQINKFLTDENFQEFMADTRSVLSELQRKKPLSHQFLMDEMSKGTMRDSWGKVYPLHPFFSVFSLERDLRQIKITKNEEIEYLKRKLTAELKRNATRDEIAYFSFVLSYHWNNNDESWIEKFNESINGYKSIFAILEKYNETLPPEDSFRYDASLLSELFLVKKWIPSAVQTQTFFTLEKLKVAARCLTLEEYVEFASQDISSIWRGNRLNHQIVLDTLRSQNIWLPEFLSYFLQGVLLFGDDGLKVMFEYIGQDRNVRELFEDQNHYPLFDYKVDEGVPEKRGGTIKRFYDALSDEKKKAFRVSVFFQVASSTDEDSLGRDSRQQLVGLCQNLIGLEKDGNTWQELLFKHNYIFPAINKLRDDLLGTNGKAFHSWKMFKKLDTLATFYKRAELTQKLVKYMPQQLGQEVSEDIARLTPIEKEKMLNYFMFIVRHPGISDMQVIEKFIDDPLAFFGLHDGEPSVPGSPGADAYFEQPFIDLDPLATRNAFILGKMDDLQVFKEHSIDFYAKVGFSEDLENMATDELLSFLFSKAETVDLKSLGDALKVRFSKRRAETEFKMEDLTRQGKQITRLEANLKLLDQVEKWVESEQFKNGDMPEAIRNIFKTSKINFSELIENGLQINSEKFRIRIVSKSDPQAQTTGDATRSCMGFGSTKNNQFWLIPTAGYLVISREEIKDGEPWERILAASVITPDRRIPIKVSELVEKIKKSDKLNLFELLGSDFQGQVSNGVTFSADNVEGQVNFGKDPKAKKRFEKDVVEAGYRAFVESYIGKHPRTPRGRSFLNRMVVGLSYGDFSDNLERIPNYYLPPALLFYSDKLGQEVGEIELDAGPSENSATNDVQGVQSLSVEDVLQVAYLQNQVHNENLKKHVGNIEVELTAAIYNERIQGESRRNLSYGYFENGKLMGYVVAYVGKNKNTDEEVVYISDFAVIPDYKGKVAASLLLDKLGRSIQEVASQRQKLGKKTNILFYSQDRVGGSYNLFDIDQNIRSKITADNVDVILKRKRDRLEKWGFSIKEIKQDVAGRAIVQMNVEVKPLDLLPQPIEQRLRGEEDGRGANSSPASLLDRYFVFQGSYNGQYAFLFKSMALAWAWVEWFGSFLIMDQWGAAVFSIWIVTFAMAHFAFEFFILKQPLKQVFNLTTVMGRSMVFGSYLLMPVFDYSSFTPLVLHLFYDAFAIFSNTGFQLAHGIQVVVNSASVGGQFDRFRAAQLLEQMISSPDLKISDALPSRRDAAIQLGRQLQDPNENTDEILALANLLFSDPNRTVTSVEAVMRSGSDLRKPAVHVGFVRTQDASAARGEVRKVLNQRSAGSSHQSGVLLVVENQDIRDAMERAFGADKKVRFVLRGTDLGSQIENFAEDISAQNVNILVSRQMAFSETELAELRQLQGSIRLRVNFLLVLDEAMKIAIPVSINELTQLNLAKERLLATQA